MAYQNKRQVYAILFEAVAATLKTIAADPSIWAASSASQAGYTYKKTADGIGMRKRRRG